jgi:hypothetical protein
MITKEFVTAGRAVFTLEIPAEFQNKFSTKPHYTYKVTHKEASGQYREAWFVSLLTGPENTHDFTYMGMLDPENGKVNLTQKSRYPSDSWPVNLFQRSLLNVWNGTQRKIIDAGFKLHHEGRCGRCGRALTVPTSVESGIGPECAKRM